MESNGKDSAQLEREVEEQRQRIESSIMTGPDYPSYKKDYPLSGPTTGSESLAETAKADIATLGEELSQQAASLGEEAKAQVGELAEKAKGMAGEQKDLLVTQLGGVSDAIEKVAARGLSRGRRAARLRGQPFRNRQRASRASCRQGRWFGTYSIRQ